MKKFSYIFLIVLSWISTNLFAQKVYIPDEKFRTYLKGVYPFLMNGDSMLLNQTNRVVGAFNVQNLGIQNLEGIQYLTQISNVNISYNKLKELPRGISQLKRIQQFVAIQTHLEVCPNFKNMPNLKVLYLSSNYLTTVDELMDLPLLEELYLDDNQLIRLPIMLNNFQNLKIVVANNNQLTGLPYLKDLKNIQIFSLYNNRLSFEQLEPLSSWISANALKNYVFPQDTIRLIDKINLKEGDNLTIQLPTKSINSIYHWYHNQTFLKTTTENKLSIDVIDLNTSGEYYCEIENKLPVFEKNKITTSRVMVDIETCIQFSKVNFYLAETPTCLNKGKINIESDIKSDYSVKYILKNTTYNETYESSQTQFVIDKGGLYQIHFTANEGKCERTIQYTLWVDELDCPTYKGDILRFSPNNDGQNDTFLINYIGNVSIYNRDGKLVRTLTAPVYWDGLDDYKRELTTGLYFIYVEDDILLQVTLIR